jgi:hypothetical protein
MRTTGIVNMKRSKVLVLVVALILTVSAITAVWLLVGKASSSRVAQLQAASVRISLDDLQTAPFNADPAAGGSPTASLARIRADDGASPCQAASRRA